MNPHQIDMSIRTDNQHRDWSRWLGILLLLVFTGCGEVLDQLDESAGKDQTASAGAAHAPPPPSPPLPPTPEQVDKDAVKKVLANMRAISDALRKYQNDQGHLPAAATYSAEGKPLLSWRVALLPSLGLGDLFEQFHQDEPWDSQHNLALAEKIPEVYQSPLREKSSKTNYLVPVGPLTLFGQKEGISLDDVNGDLHSATLVVEVNNSRAVTWTQPDELNTEAEDPESSIGKAHLEGFYLMFADFRVEFQSNTLTADVLASYLSLKKGQINIPEPEKPYSPGLAGESERAFEAGRGGDAVRLLKGAALVGSPGVELTELMRWSPALRRPTMAVRWGVGWQTFGKQKFAVAGSTPAERASQARRQGIGSKGIEGSTGVPGSTTSLKSALQSFKSHTFDFGDKLLGDLSDQCDRGFFGIALKKQAGKEEERPRTLGLAFSGITVLGEGEPQFIQQEALKSGCDLLLFAEAKYRDRGKLGTDPQNKTLSSTLTLKIIQVTLGEELEELWVSKPITSGHIERIKKNPSAGADPLEDMHDQFTEFVKQNLALADLPDLNADQVKRRVVSLISPAPSDPLDVLIEIKLYESLKLLTAEEVSKVYQRLLGEVEGAQLATGTPAEREKAIEQWLP